MPGENSKKSADKISWFEGIADNIVSFFKRIARKIISWFPAQKSKPSESSTQAVVKQTTQQPSAVITEEVITEDERRAKQIAIVQKRANEVRPEIEAAKQIYEEVKTLMEVAHELSRNSYSQRIPSELNQNLNRVLHRLEHHFKLAEKGDPKVEALRALTSELIGLKKQVEDSKPQLKQIVQNVQNIKKDSPVSSEVRVAKAASTTHVTEPARDRVAGLPPVANQELASPLNRSEMNIYPQELIAALGLDNVASLPLLPNLVLGDPKVSTGSYLEEDGYLDVYYVHKYTPIHITQLQGNRAVRGTTESGRPLISFISNGEVITLFNRCERARPDDSSLVDEWVVMRGEQRQDAWHIYWPHVGPEFRAALSDNSSPAPNSPNRFR